MEVMAGENTTNDVDEEVYGNDGAERHEAQEASAGDRRAIADADQAGQLDISGETKTERIPAAAASCLCIVFSAAGIIISLTFSRPPAN